MVHWWMVVLGGSSFYPALSDIWEEDWGLLSKVIEGSNNVEIPKLPTKQNRMCWESPRVGALFPN
jgi:hypothetical protein